MSSMLEVQGVARDKNDSFPYSGMRLLGCIQLNIGILVFVLGVTDIIVTMVTYYDDAKTYGEDYDTIVSLTIASSPLWCGMWYSITGALGLCITRDRASSLQFLKIGFLILNILCCAMFGPVCAVICGYISYRRHNLGCCGLQWLLTLIICFLAVLEVVMATASAAVTCCCSPLRATQIHILVNPEGISGLESDPDLTRESTRASNTEVNRDKEEPRQRHVKEHKNNDKKIPDDVINKKDNRRDPDPDFEPIREVGGAKKPRVEVEEPIVDGFGGSAGYSKLKKWALPHW